ncbi:unnamed protein product [Protopolystoma xenopodis]|uniref:Uncharacterized protein n=1 Tax=Protopolystoma xenopodis TaxID=117903 RepID=A0A448WT46_9PLAT|nr:unnamed protein product [Protopolystoma xenopodis]
MCDPAHSRPSGRISAITSTEGSSTSLKRRTNLESLSESAAALTTALITTSSASEVITPTNTLTSAFHPLPALAASNSLESSETAGATSGRMVLGIGANTSGIVGRQRKARQNESSSVECGINGNLQLKDHTSKQ